MPRPPKQHTRIGLRVPVELYEWLNDYSSRTGQGMSQIIKAHLESLKRQVISHVVPPSAYD